MVFAFNLKNSTLLPQLIPNPNTGRIQNCEIGCNLHWHQVCLAVWVYFTQKVIEYWRQSHLPNSFNYTEKKRARDFARTN
jgi:hypothetical protein